MTNEEAIFRHSIPCLVQRTVCPVASRNSGLHQQIQVVGLGTGETLRHPRAHHLGARHPGIERRHQRLGHQGQQPLWNQGVGRLVGRHLLAWDDEPTKSKFRVYKSAEESYNDHSKILKNGGRYQSLFNYSVYDYRSWANGLQKAGYATSKKYAKALIGYIDAYELYSINGGVKLKPGKKSVIVKKTTKTEELSQAEEFVIDASEKTEEEEEVTRVLQRVVVEINEVRCTILYPGETISSISMKYNIPKNKILDYNDTANENDIHEGDIVYLQKKKRKYLGPQDFYRVKSGDSLYSISQQFGIRTSSLAKMNGKDPFAPLMEGEKIKIK